MKRPFLALNFLVLGILATVSPAAEHASQPAAPADLLRVLPEVPISWTLVQSQAQSSLGGWLQTRAVRTFQPAPQASGAPSAGSVEIAIVDGGGSRASIADFVDFKPGKSGLLERLLIAGYPALRFQESEATVSTQILLASRYIVEVKITGLPNEKIETWLHAFHFNTLPRQAPGASTPPSPIVLSSIDELHPELNRTYSLSPSSTAAPTSVQETATPPGAAAADLQGPGQASVLEKH